MIPRRSKSGFTLVEIIVVAPIVILAIGAFIAAAVNMTGEVMTSRGSSAIMHDIQDSLNRIEQDIKLSVGFLAENNIGFSSSNPQGVGPGGTENFENVRAPDGTVLILVALATNGNPLSEGVGGIYTNSPNSCASGAYAENHPLYINIVYFVENNTLWRRTVMPTNYTSGSLCGGTVWQRPSCAPGYTSSFCKTEDTKLLDGVSRSDFSVSYYSMARDSNAVTRASDDTVPVDQRNVALTGTQTADVSISVSKKIAGRDISRTGNIRATRLDINATAIADIVVPSLSGKSPTVNARVVDGNEVIFDWPQLDGAVSYNARYRTSINGGTSYSSWTNIPGTFSNSERTYRLTQSNHGDLVQFSVRGRNSDGQYSSYGVKDIEVPVWATLPMQAGWTRYSATYASPSYTMTRSGMVMIRGMIKDGTTANNTVVAELPPKYRPSGTLIFGTTTAGSNWSRIDVRADGALVLRSTNFSASWTSLDAIRYAPASAGHTWTRPSSLSNGFAHYGAEFEEVRHTQDSVGRVHIQGLARYGNNFSNTTVIMPLPTNRVPSQLLLHAGASSVFQHLGVHTTGVQTRTTGTTSFSSMNMRYLPSSHTAWKNMPLSGSWVAYGGVYATPQYSKTSDNVVNVKGLLKGGVTTSSTVMATLPANCRPEKRMLYTTVSNHQHVRMDITELGQILFMGGTNSYISLDNITFIASEAGAC